MTMAEPQKHVLPGVGREFQQPPDEPRALFFRYRNHRGEEAWRKVCMPMEVFWGETEHHPERQWFLNAWDMDREDRRDFALADILEIHRGPDA